MRVYVLGCMSNSFSICIRVTGVNSQVEDSKILRVIIKGMWAEVIFGILRSESLSLRIKKSVIYWYGIVQHWSSMHSPNGLSVSWLRKTSLRACIQVFVASTYSSRISYWRKAFNKLRSHMLKLICYEKFNQYLRIDSIQVLPPRIRS